MFLHLEQILISLASHVHLTAFSFIVSFIEEVIPPIPSPSVMIAAGSMAQVQHYTMYGIALLILLGAIGKTCGAGVAYYVSGKVEDLFAGKISKFIGITPEQIESFGARLSRNWKDYVVLIVLRSLPIVPSTLISVGGGLLKINFKLFIISTFIGSLIRDFIYIYLGFVATNAVLKIFIENTNGVESAIQIVAVLAVVVLLGFLYFRRKKA
jgi:membrane protein DedA with SNARE-associated domain